MWPFDNLASSIGRPCVGRLTLKQGVLSPNCKKGMGSCLKPWEAKEWEGKGLSGYETIRMEALSALG